MIPKISDENARLGAYLLVVVVVAIAFWITALSIQTNSNNQNRDLQKTARTVLILCDELNKLNLEIGADPLNCKSLPLFKEGSK